MSSKSKAPKQHFDYACWLTMTALHLRQALSYAEVCLVLVAHIAVSLQMLCSTPSVRSTLPIAPHSQQLCTHMLPLLQGWQCIAPYLHMLQAQLQHRLTLHVIETLHYSDNCMTARQMSVLL